MSIYTAVELPIGFGLGKDQKHWEQVYQERFELTIGESRAVIHQQKLPTPLLDKDSLNFEIISLIEVSVLLRCSIGQARRISRTELPARKGPGRQLLYLKTEVIDYIKCLPPVGRRNSGLSSSGSEKNVGTVSHRAAFDLRAAREKLSTSNE